MNDKKVNFLTNPYLSFYGFFGYLFNDTLNSYVYILSNMDELHINNKHSLKDSDRETL
jgi:hypothetical protein